MPPRKLIRPDSNNDPQVVSEVAAHFKTVYQTVRNVNTFMPDMKAAIEHADVDASEVEKTKLKKCFVQEALRQCQVCTGMHGPERDCPLKKRMDKKAASIGLKAEWGRTKPQLYYQHLPPEEQKPRARARPYAAAFKRRPGPGAYRRYNR